MPKKATITFATFNLSNFQYPGQSVFQGTPIKKAAYEKQRTWTAGMLAECDADIIGFQELWDRRCLKEALQEAGLDSVYSVYDAEANGKHQSVALAIREPFKKQGKITRHEKFPKTLKLVKLKSATAEEPEYQVSVNITKFSRPVLQISVKPQKGPDIIVFVAHLKSKLAMKLGKETKKFPSIKPHTTAIGSALSTIRRTSEAAALRVILNPLMKNTNTPVAVMGDLNDAQLGVIAEIITDKPGYRLYKSSRRGYKSDKGLYSVATLQEYRSLRDVYYTYLHDGQHESLDHILVSEQFYDHSKNRIWSFKEIRILNDHLEDSRASYVSDHGICCSTFIYDKV